MIIFFISYFSNPNLSDSNNVLYVDVDGNFDYELIQDAINNAISGDKIFIYEGIYNENIIINKSITLTGENKTKTLLIGTNNVIQISSDNVIVEELTISSGLNGINILNSSESKITENNIINNKIGIYIDNQSWNNLVYSNNFINNTYNAYDKGDNIWYNIRYNEGNYWDDFDEPTEGAFDNDSDGIVDNPYTLDIGLNKDLYPKINAISIVPFCNFFHSPQGANTFDIIIFNDTSYDSDGYITTWFWDFGDGITSNLKNTTHKYKNDGIYNITLEITDNYGLINKCTKKINIFNSKPIVKFYYMPHQPDDVDNVIFYDESYDKDGGIVKWEWDFGDSTILLNPENPREITHKYKDNGIYNVTLKIYDNDNSMNSTTIEINVKNVNPSANFYYKSNNNSNLLIIKNEEIRFFDTSNDADGEIIKYHWDFDDRSISNLTNPIHIFNKSGTYVVTLTVYDNDNESNTKKIPITVLSKYDPPNKISFPSGMSLLVIVIIIFILILVLIAIRMARKI